VAGPDDFEGFEWDEEKSARCYEDRGFDFAYAAKHFDGDFIEWEDRRRDWVSHGSSASVRSKGGS
jgi:uncharacterized DUF497 family protein